MQPMQKYTQSADKQLHSSVGLGGIFALDLCTRSGKCQRAAKNPDAACKLAAWLLAS